MSDNKESITQDKEIETKEEVAVETTETVENDGEVLVEETKVVEKAKKGEVTFLKRFEALVIDQIFAGAVAYILLLIFDIALRYTAGYYVDNMVGMYLIFYIGCSILCPLISESTKLKSTIGRKFAGLKTVAE